MTDESSAIPTPTNEDDAVGGSQLANIATPISQVRRRLTAIGLDASADTFFATSYLAEAAIKLLALTLRAALAESASLLADRIGYDLVRADGLGSWAQAIQQMSTQPLVGSIPVDLRPLVVWISKKSNKESWFSAAAEGVETVLRALGEETGSGTKERTTAGLLAALVQIRNKTKGHGALGPDFFYSTNPAYTTAVSALVDTCPAFRWNWFAVFRRTGGTSNVVVLNGPEPMGSIHEEFSRYSELADGVYFTPLHSQRIYSLGTLLRCNRECSSFRLPNGGYRDGGESDFIDYSCGVATRERLDGFSTPPVPLPPSETHGLHDLAIQSNVFGNLPPVPSRYVERLKLQSDLEEKLKDRNHTIITLHGRGGVGKTSLALYLAHRLASEASPHFDQIVWFSARDIDLRPSGPRPVTAAVVTLKDVSRTYATLFGSEPTEAAFAEVLRGSQSAAKGTLFIFDNFETMEHTIDLHRFLDTYTHLPNKVLITSRERAFKADYPIEIRGMEYNEAATMLKAGAQDLGIAGLVDDDVIKRIYDYTEGHAYIMRVILGEIAKQNRFVPPRTVVSHRIDIVNAVFERSFDQLSTDARRVFLVVANWKSAVSELALIVVLGQRDIPVERAVEELKRFALVSEESMTDGRPCYFAPQLARVFGQTKLVGDPDRPLINEDLEAVRSFGVLEIGRTSEDDQGDQLDRFFEWCDKQAHTSDASGIRRLDEMLVMVADLWPPAWLNVAGFRRKYAPSDDRRSRVEYALRRAVEEMPFNTHAWLQRAKFAGEVGDTGTRVTSLISAVESDPSDNKLLTETARVLINYIRANDVAPQRRGSYLASVRGHMERQADRLDADDLSKLSWLFLLESDRDKATRYATLGLRKDKHNAHCKSILDRLTGETARVIPGLRR